jgi:hypothetical protein
MWESLFAPYLVAVVSQRRIADNQIADTVPETHATCNYAKHVRIKKESIDCSIFKEIAFIL